MFDVFKCPENNTCYFVCTTNECYNHPYICRNASCKCHSDHEECGFMMLKQIQNNYYKKYKLRKQKIDKKVNYLKIFQAKISDLIHNKMEEIKQYQYENSLGRYEKMFQQLQQLQQLQRDNLSRQFIRHLNNQLKDDLPDQKYNAYDIDNIQLQLEMKRAEIQQILNKYFRHKQQIEIIHQKDRPELSAQQKIIALQKQILDIDKIINQYQEIALMIGLPGSGKTVSSYILSNKKVISQMHHGNLVYRYEQKYKDAQISHTNRISTLRANIFQLQNHKKVILDLPDISTNRNFVSYYSTVFGLNKIFKNKIKTKFLVVIEESQLIGSKKNLIQKTMQILLNIITNSKIKIEDLGKSVGLLITKAKLLSEKAMKDILSHQLNFCKSGTKKLLAFIVQHDQLKAVYAWNKQIKNDIYIKMLNKLEAAIVDSVITEVCDNGVHHDQFTKFKFDQDNLIISINILEKIFCNRFLEPQNKYRIEAVILNNKNDKVENKRKLDTYQKLKLVHDYLILTKQFYELDSFSDCIKIIIEFIGVLRRCMDLDPTQQEYLEHLDQSYQILNKLITYFQFQQKYQKHTLSSFLGFTSQFRKHFLQEIIQEFLNVVEIKQIVNGIKSLQLFQCIQNLQDLMQYMEQNIGQENHG